MIEFTFAGPGEGKSLDLARTALWLLDRSEYVEKKLGLRREVWGNFHLSAAVQERYPGRYHYYDDLFQLTKLKDVDVMVDEVAVYLPADKWKDTHFEVRRMLAQHRKRGLEIYANTQDYRMVDINFRRMVKVVRSVKKMMGNPDPSPTLPPIRRIWGVILVRELDKHSIEDSGEQHPIHWLPRPFLIRRKLVEAYDTREDIRPSPPPRFHHIERVCEREDCDFHKVEHR